MKKRTGVLLAILVLLVLTQAAQELAGKIIFWTALVMVVIYGIWPKGGSKPKPSANQEIEITISIDADPAPSRNAEHRRNLQTTPAQDLRYMDLEPPESDADAARRGWDWNLARAQLQKVAYGMVGNDVSQQDKDEFRLFMARFALHDPLYQETMKRVKPMLEQNPGIQQSHLYKNDDERTKEMARYILYFAEVLGHIRRVKKGNSYRLYLPGQPTHDEKVTTSVTERRTK